MTIEEAIKQTKPFRSNKHKAAVNIIYTHNWLSSQIKTQLKPFGITSQQYNVLRILRGANKPISTSSIRERLLDKMSDTSRIVDRLYKKNLVHREECAHDKRLVDVSLSEDGETLLANLELLNEGIDNLLANLEEEEALLLSKLLDKARG